MTKSYGAKQSNHHLSREEYVTEALDVNGFYIWKNYLSQDWVEQITSALDRAYVTQSSKFTHAQLSSVNELNIVRLPLQEDPIFFKCFDHPALMPIMEKLLNGPIQMHLQNGIINKPSKEHHQSSWHRDLPYQNFISDELLSLSLFICLAPFNKVTGGTRFLPGSHKVKYLPSAEFIAINEEQPELEPGDAILFNSMTFHAAGNNSSDLVRYGINNMFTRPILKQQIDIPNCIKIEDVPKELRSVLGHNYEVPTSPEDYRQKRLNRLNQ